MITIEEVLDNPEISSLLVALDNIRYSRGKLNVEAIYAIFSQGADDVYDDQFIIKYIQYILTVKYLCQMLNKTYCKVPNVFGSDACCILENVDLSDHPKKTRLIFRDKCIFVHCRTAYSLYNRNLEDDILDWTIFLSAKYSPLSIGDSKYFKVKEFAPNIMKEFLEKVNS